MSIRPEVLLAKLKREIALRQQGDEALAKTVAGLPDASATIAELKRKVRVLREETKTLTAASEDSSARVDEVERVGAGERIALAERITSLSSSLDSTASDLSSVAARVSTIETTYATDAEVVASIAQAIAADKVNQNISIHASVSYEAGVRIAADSALAFRASALEASIDTPTTGLLARVTAIETAYVDASAAEAIAQSEILAALTGPGGTIYGAVQTEASARAAADGSIHAKWGVALDINGRIAGRINLDGTNQSSSFVVAVDKFVVENANGTVTAMDIRTGGKIVFGADVQSDNFVSGSVGWQIQRNTGDAEFNKITVRNGIFITGLVAPAITPSVDFTTSVSVTITGSGGTIRYTDDGTQPTASSAAYSSPITVSTTKTIRARVFAATGEAGPESQATYTLVPSGGGGSTGTLVLTASTGNPLDTPTGGGTFALGSIVPISANAFASGAPFIKWSGSSLDLVAVENEFSPNTTVRVAGPVSLTADY